MQHFIRTLWPLFFGIVLMMAGNGLQGTLLGIRATLENFNTETTGLIMSLYYGGYLVGCVVAPRLVAGVGHIRVFTAMASLASTAALLHGLFIDPWIWAAARIITGFCFAALYIVIESWMNDIATNDTRGRIMGAYLVAFYGAMVLGQYALHLAPPLQIDLFVMVSILISISLLPICLSSRPAPEFSTPAPITVRALFNASPLGVAAVALTGMTGGIIFSIAPVYATQTGMDIRELANFMALFVIGGMAAQIPMGYLSDHIPRRRMIAGLAILAAAAASLCWHFSENLLALNCSFLLLGIFGLSIYGIGAAYTNDHLNRAQYVSASAKLILVNGAGAFAGPFLASLFMGHFGTAAFFPFIGAIFAAIALFAAIRAIANPGEGIVDDKAPFTPLIPQIEPLTAKNPPDGEAAEEEEHQPTAAMLNP